MRTRAKSHSLGLAAALMLGVAGLGARAQPPEDLPGNAYHRSEAAAKAAFVARLQRGLALENPATAAYDVQFYDLQLDVDPVGKWLTGSMTMRARTVHAPLDSLQLDFDDAMQVDAVSAGGSPTSFTHSHDILALLLDRSYAAGEAFEVQVTYQGRPDSTARNFVFDSHGGEPLVWTLSEPFGARTWWPCKDTPSDKADSVQVEITVPQGMIAVSQGTLTGTTTPGPGRTAYRWRERHPISTYLVSIAAHAYTVQTVTYTPVAGGSMPLTVWSYPEDSAAALEAANLSAAVLRTFAGLFGEYPFADEKYGYAQCNFGGGMEHQTATSAGNWGTGLVVHETAHQWFGDAVTLRDFSHIWLNEGFATYAEALWAEAQSGRAAYQAFIWGRRTYAPGTIWVPHPETATFGRIFDASLSYSKGAWVLHMLRGVLGDDVFFRALRTYAQDSRTAYGTATTEDFQAIVEEVSGRDLSRFFTNWIYRPYYPTYLYDFSSQPAAGGWNVHLDIEQLQTQAVYDMPVPVRVLTRSGNVDVTLPDSLALQSFDLHVGAEPLDVQIDPEHWVLHSSERALHDPTFSDGVLVVNGVSWVSPFAAEAAAAYGDSVFAGRFPFQFWDLFPTPTGGYVPQLPAPIGHGPIPPETLGRFSTVVWIGNVYAEDLDYWNSASIVSYLRQGGNVLLLARRGQEFLSPSRAGYLGLRWAEDPVATLGSATPARGGLVPMSALDVQTQCAAFETGFDAAETQLLFTDATDFAEPRGIGAWRRPAGGGSVRPNGGNFAFVSGRPYRWAHGPLRANVQTILATLFQEPMTLVLASLDVAQGSDGIRLDWRLEGSTHISNLELRRSTVGEAPLPLAHWLEPERHGTWLDRDARTGQLYSYELLADFGSGPVRVAARDVVRSGTVPVARTRLLPVTPNPFNPGIVLHYELARPGRASLRVLDAKGRRARLLFDTELPSGSGTYLWDGRDDSGRHAASGVYLISLESGGIRSTAKATLAR